MAITNQDIEEAGVDVDVEFLLKDLLAEINALKAAPPSSARKPIAYTIEYDDGSSDLFNLVP